MTKFLFIFFSLWMVFPAFSQPESYQKAVTEFQGNYNEGNYKAIFEKFSSEMKDVLPQENAIQFFNGLQFQLGKIEETEFIEFQQGSWALYKTQFERGLLALNISVNEQSFINGLSLTPYQEPQKKAASTTVNALETYPEPIVNTIFPLVKDFPEGTQLSIAILENGKPHYYGIIKEKDSIKPIQNQQAVFEIGSITKVFTSTLLANLVQKGSIELSQPINSFYPFKFNKDISLSFESLANHTSGLGSLPSNLDLSNEENPYKDYGEKELYEYLQNLMEVSDHKTYAYSNLGTGILGHTLEKITHQPMVKLLQDQIFGKLEMNHTYTRSADAGSQLIKGQDPDGNPVSNWDFDVLFGAGGILSTTEDLLKFAKVQWENKEMALAHQPTFKISPDMEIGLGWHLLSTENNQNLLWHNGGTGGYSSSLIVDKSQQKAVVILSNVSGFHPQMQNIDRLAFGLMGLN